MLKEEIKGIIKKLRREKKELREVIPEGYVRCRLCGNIVPEGDSVISLPEEWRICDKCFFKGAK